MTISDTQDPRDRFFSALVYLLPMFDALPFGQFMLRQFPFLGIIYAPFTPLINFYFNFPFASFIIFLLLFIAVVRNQRISYFIRFNTLQSILIGILVSLVGIVLQFLFKGMGGVNIVMETLFNVVFLATLAASLYGIVQSILGRRAEIPTISEAAYSQLPY
jgi:hypothetical protein